MTKQRKPVHLIVGPMQDSVQGTYIGSAKELLDLCKNLIVKHPRLVLTTTNPNLVLAFQAIHKAGEIELVVERRVGDSVMFFQFDTNGEFIEPWPDEFFEIGFFLRFPDIEPMRGNHGG